MFGAKTKKKEDDTSRIMQKSTRGNMDEYEALRTVVAENTGLLVRILEKIRVQRTLSGKTSQTEVSANEKDSKSTPKK